MRITTLVSLLLCAGTTYAQDNKPKTNEIGLMGEVNITGYGQGQTGLAGIQYKHFGKKNIGYRIFAGFGEVQNSNYGKVYSSSGDTVTERSTSLGVSMPMIGGGIEGQHPLYKHVYMYAALELRAGYNRGRIDTSIVQHYTTSTPGQVNGTGEYGTRMTGPETGLFFVGFTPAVGIKVMFSRITIGTEFSNLVSYSNANKISGSSLDFDSGRINERFFIHYRF